MLSAWLAAVLLPRGSRALEVGIISREALMQGAGAAMGLGYARAALCAEDIAEESEETSAIDLVSDVSRVLEREFVGELGPAWSAAKRSALAAAYESPESGSAIAAELARSVGDPYTRLVVGASGRGVVRRATGALRVGIKFPADGEAVVLGVVDGSPAAASGLAPGDRIASVNGKKVRSAEDAALLIATGGTVALADGRQILVGRGLRSIERVSTAIVAFSDVASTSADELRVLAGDFSIIDLRGNGGGSLDGAAECAKLFLKRGQTVATVIEKRSRRVVVADADGPFSREPTPLYLLVDNRTASAAELFAGALRDNRRALLVAPPPGTTFGKAKIQRAEFLPGGDILFVTRASYELPKSGDISGAGLRADRLAPAGGGCVSSPEVCVAQSTTSTLDDVTGRPST